MGLPGTFLKNARGMLLTNGLLLAAFWISGNTWLYSVWGRTYITPFPLFIRIRSMAEHACLKSSPDVLRSTRTTQASWVARACVAPIRVNFHFEHHLMASVPYFRLPKLHALLRQRGYVPPHLLAGAQACEYAKSQSLTDKP